jgi:hypothetical protein
MTFKRMPSCCLDFFLAFLVKVVLISLQLIAQLMMSLGATLVRLVKIWPSTCFIELSMEAGFCFPETATAPSQLPPPSQSQPPLQQLPPPSPPPQPPPPPSPAGPTQNLGWATRPLAVSHGQTV